ncbi:hypothetical protein [Hymenobacter terrenus]|uniref:hypothetical protein n=1 Tax=Hymenobacter terrenus TaxID=1629124 RepID=UPI000619AA9A|nr:hypothetical protein [Hymenobacter terrenus]
MEPTQPAATPAKTKRPKTRNVPQGDKAFSEVFDLAVAEWGLRPQLTLEWTTQATAAALATKLREGLRTAGDADDAISPQVQRLAELDLLIDGSKKEGKLKYVKKALALQYDDENDGRPYYGEFGIEKIGSTYTLPRDRGKRAEALLKLAKAVADPKHGLADGKYGKAFWKAIADEYNELQPQAAKATGTRATEVVGKDQFREEAEGIFLALLLLIEANYPKTYQAERRKFGVLKESY